MVYTGTMRDVVQNHLLQVISLLAMEPPAGHLHDIREEKAKVLRAIVPVRQQSVVRGQFAGYQDEAGVARDSPVETFVALRCHIDTRRWSGVPFYVRAGKRLPATATEVLVRLRRPTARSLGEGRLAAPNYLRFALSPDIAISLGAQVKAQGEAMAGQDVELAFYEQHESAELAPYERLLGDALAGDASLFAREDAVEAAWRAVGQVLGDAAPLRPYEPGTWGPDEAVALIARHGWYDPPVRGEELSRASWSSGQLSPAEGAEHKRVAAGRVADLVGPGMVVGPGGGSTAAFAV